MQLEHLEAELQREINEQGYTEEEAGREFQEALVMWVYNKAKGELHIKEATRRINALSYEDQLLAWKAYRKMRERLESS